MISFSADLFDGVEQSDDDDDDEEGITEAEPPKPAKKTAPKGGISLFGGAIKKGFFQKVTMFVEL